MEPDPTTRAVQVTTLPSTEPVSIVTADGVRLAGIHLTAGRQRPDVALIHVHGFTHHTGRQPTRRVAAGLAARADVVAFDLRGHGRSGGRNTVGDREILDVDAAVAWARAAGYARVATIGFSLGAAVVLGQAGRGAHRPDTVVAVSGPARWYSRETPAMRRVHWVLEQPHGRAVGRLLGVRLDRPWAEVPPSPVELVADIAPRPLLLVYFADDPYFALTHPRALVAASGGHAQLWIEPGRGHGENGTGAPLAGRIAGWAAAAAGATDGAAGPGDASAGTGSTVEGRDPADRRAASSEVR